MDNQQIQRIKHGLIAAQAKIKSMLLCHEKNLQFVDELWHYPDGGGGLSCRSDGGVVIEKAGINRSDIQGKQLPNSALSALDDRSMVSDQPFKAMGLSCIIHPYNPHAPTTHLNVRFIQVGKIWWFGGGMDLTPYVGYQDDCQTWHQACKAACMSLSKQCYDAYKQACDDYFYLPHRREHRGIGGIFFDHLNHCSFDQGVLFIEQVVSVFLTSYQTILSRRCLLPFSKADKAFQQYRRSRYVEFNLLYDRGTHFGLQSSGNIAAILSSMPPVVAWPANLNADLVKREEALIKQYLTPKEWAQ
ncbi:oxygen-dependent coproporphyrinogen oxidase [Gammaproteobacteria bacterium]|nr:oxygen-dependent coproporphyrinogen oxidase [Gammaproteobacteria bacterium]